jgi:hypothetical protein
MYYTNNFLKFTVLFLVLSSCQFNSRDEEELKYKKRLSTVVDSMEQSYQSEKKEEDKKESQQNGDITKVDATAKSVSISTENTINNNNIKFSTNQDVSIYLNGKTFYSKDHTIRVSISNVVVVNGNPAFFNLTFVALSANLGMVTGQSMSADNPNLVIKILIHPDEGSIDFKGDYLYLNP